MSTDDGQLKKVPTTQSGRHVDVVVPVRNGAEWLAALIKQLDRQQVPPGVVVRWFFVDDGSTDTTLDVLERVSDPRSNVLSLPENMGRAAARNAGVAAGNGQLLLLLDADCVPHVGLVREHLSNIESGLDISFGPVTGMGEGFWAAYQSRVACEREKKAGSGDFLAMTTANAMIKREVFEQVGGYDEAYRYYGFEDRDLVHRLLTAGAKAGFSDQAAVEHRLQPDLRRMCDHMLESGAFTAALFRQRFPDSYRKSAFARFDRTRVGVIPRLFLDAATSQREFLLRVTDALVCKNGVPFALKLFLVRACVGLSYYAGTIQQAEAES